jgi:hypothetical protein
MIAPQAFDGRYHGATARRGAPMKLIETTISETTIRMQYADDPDPEKAQEWLDFQVPLKGMELPSGPLGDSRERSLRLIQAAALRKVRDLVDDEIRAALSPSDTKREPQG